ncbi:hypothetical protein K439DRAFT_383389 [Ramaria rubella]|nr:hypothetical protein K439DRAFT_383389 [Ramaria rubella]
MPVVADDPPSTPQSQDSDTKAYSVPFIFEDGILSFYTPYDSAPGSSPRTSSVSDSSSDNSVLDTPLSRHSLSTPFLRSLAFWEDNDEEDIHVYAETSSGTTGIPHDLGTISLESLDPSTVYFAPIHAAITQLSCPFMHANIPLATLPSAAPEDTCVANSMITISSPRHSPMRLVSTIYNRGTLVFSSENQMTAESPSRFGDVIYSSSLPQKCLQEIWKNDANPCSNRTPSLATVALLRFVQPAEMAEDGDEDVLVIVCDFQKHTGLLPAQIEVSHLVLEKQASYNIPPGTQFISTPQADFKFDASDPILFKRRRSSTRPIPKLSVAIPPPTFAAVNRIQLLSASSVNARRTPHTGVPQSALPVTPFDQLIHTPASPPSLPHSTMRSREKYAPSPAESAYPFTLSSDPPSTHSPVLGLLDSLPRRMIPKDGAPFTPSFLHTYPPDTSASMTMNSITQRALDAGTTRVKSKGAYLDPCLASAHILGSAPLSSSSQASPSTIWSSSSAEYPYSP